MNGVLNSDSRSRSSPIRRTPFAQTVILGLAEPLPRRRLLAMVAQRRSTEEWPDEARKRRISNRGRRGRRGGEHRHVAAVARILGGGALDSGVDRKWKFK